MDELWEKIIKVTGAVGLVTLLIYTTLQYVFSDQIVALFGSEKMFVITIIIIASLFIILTISILWTKKDTSHKSTEKPKVKVVYQDQSTHHGDNNF